MKITFEINTKFLSHDEAHLIIDYVSSNLLSASSYYAEDMHIDMEGNNSCPFAKIDMKFTIEHSDFDDRYALSDGSAFRTEEELDEIMRDVKL